MAQNVLELQYSWSTCKPKAVSNEPRGGFSITLLASIFMLTVTSKLEGQDQYGKYGSNWLVISSVSVAIEMDKTRFSISL